MRDSKLKSLFIFCFFVLTTYVADAKSIFQGVDSVIEESIDDSVQVQLIDAEFNNTVYISFSFIGSDLPAKIIIDGSKQRGYRFVSESFLTDYHFVIVKLPKDDLEGALEVSVNAFKQSKLNWLRITVLGSINQQRVLGNINRIYSNADLSVVGDKALQQVEPNISNNILRLPFPLDEGAAEVSKRVSYASEEESLLTTFMLCRFKPIEVPLFLISNNTIRCQVRHPEEKKVVDDKYVANYKSDLLQRLQFVNNDPFEWLQLLASFTSIDSYEQFRQFYNNLEAVSIEEVVSLYRRHDASFELAQQETKVRQQKSDLRMSQSFMEHFDVDTYELNDRVDYFGFTISVATHNICLYIDCPTLPYYVSMAQSPELATLSFKFLPQQSQQVMNEIAAEVIAPLSQLKDINQSDVMIAFNGNFAIGDLEKLFYSLGQLPSPLALDSLTQEYEHKVESDGTTVGFKIAVVPGDQDWVASELLYFKLLKNAGARLQVQKDNSVLALKPEGFFNINRKHTVFSIMPLASGIEQIEGIQQLNEEEFTALKQGLLNNLMLQDNEYQIALLSEVFALESYKQQLSLAVTELSLNDFKLFARRLSDPYTE